MYIQRTPHPLMRHRSRDPSPLDVFQSTTSETHSASTPHLTGYVALAVVLAILLCSIVGFLTVRRLHPLSLKRRAKNKVPKRNQTSAMQKGHSRFDSLSDSSSPAPSSPSSEGPPTPCTDYEHEIEHDGDLGVHSRVTQWNSCAPMPMPTYTHAQKQMHQSTLLPALESPAVSAIRPHGLPLWPVPEESSIIPTLPSVYDDNELFYRPPPA